MRCGVKAMGLAALFALGHAATAAAEGSLAVYNWGDYINPEVLDRFSKEFDVKVSLDTYGSNEEMLAKIQAGATGYDLVFPSVHMHDIMAKLDLLEKTDVNQMPGWENIDKEHLKSKTDPTGAYCLPYAWGTVGIIYNKNRVPEIKSWKDYFAFAAANPGTVIMLDDMREVLGVGLIMNGKSVNSRDPQDLELATQTILKEKPNIGAFSYEVVPLIQSADMAAAHYFVGAMMYVLEDPDNLAYVIPEEGATMYQEDICVLKSGPNKENAKKFLEFFMRPEIAALNATQQKNGTVNVKAKELLPPELRDNVNINPPADVRAKLQIFEDLGEDLRNYDRQWTKIKTN
ncbi:MAG: spermidine/putrescine ABC transporter substrate-binding protein [Rhodospirillaceae bacterium]|nr:spermidine/putrescine ABC transporter substrate-binding protein [Rhodospirillaceae bacterium]